MALSAEFGPDSSNTRLQIIYQQFANRKRAASLHNFVRLLTLQAVYELIEISLEMTTDQLGPGVSTTLPIRSKPIPVDPKFQVKTEDGSVFE